MRFRVGQGVRVADRRHEGHHRTPDYLKGATGTVARAHGLFTNPETRAYGGDGLPRGPVYQVEFAQRDLWPDYDGSDRDRLYVDVYEHWLEPAE